MDYMLTIYNKYREPLPICNFFFFHRASLKYLKEKTAREDEILEYNAVSKAHADMAHAVHPLSECKTKVSIPD